MTGLVERVRDKAEGQWPAILSHLGVPAEFLVVSKTREGPCPNCGGNTRYRFDDRHGNGDWFCSHCGGKDGRGGGGTGFDLLMRLQHWTFPEALRAVAQHLGVEDTWQSPTPFKPGRCDGFWQYTDEFAVVRRNRDTVNSKGKREKDVLPYRWNGQRWECKRPDGPLPLYNRDELRRRRDVPVLVAEGEAAADAGIRLFPELVVTTWHGGTKNVATADWAPLRGRQVYLWPDADADGEGLKAMQQVVAIAPAAEFWLVTPPEDVADGWDLADALADGWTPEKALHWLDTHCEPQAPPAVPGAPQQVDRPTAEERLPEPITFEERWAALEAHADEVAASGWPIMKAIASLSSRAGELQVTRLTERRLEQLLEQAQRRLRPSAAPIAPGGTFPIRETPWAVHSIFRHGLNLLVGQSGAGKSRLAVDCMAAWLRGEQGWLNRELYGPAVDDRHALIVGTDQDQEDWFQTLAPVGLCLRNGDGHAQLHGRVTLCALEFGLQLDAEGLAFIRRWADQHPGGMILVDSLAAVLPPGIDEDKPAAGRVVHSLAEAAGDCWTVLTHHSRKAAGKEGDLGVNAGRGSSAIAAAVSRFVALGLIHKLEHGVMVAQEADPQRELLSTKRGGAAVHLVITSNADGHWREVGPAAELKKAQQRERLRQNLPDRQAEVHAVLDERSGEWFTVKALIEELGGDWDDGTGPKGSKAALLRKTLAALAGKGLIEVGAGGLEKTYRAMQPSEDPSHG